jgi:hypothetical protein
MQDPTTCAFYNHFWHPPDKDLCPLLAPDPRNRSAAALFLCASTSSRTSIAGSAVAGADIISEECPLTAGSSADLSRIGGASLVADRFMRTG